MNASFSTPIVFSDPILLFGGPYSNLHALDALIAEAARRRIPPSRMISTGDLVAYCAHAKAVVARVRETGIRFVRGNCEEQLAAGADDCGCGFAPGGQCERLSADWFAHAMAELDADDRSFLGRAPPRIDVIVNGVTLAVIHGAAAQTNRFVFASTPERIKALDLDLLGVDGVIAGHCGLPFSQGVGGRLWHNPGAAGMPANDGTPRVWFSEIAPGDAPGVLRIEHCALDYEHAGAAEAMARAGLAPEYRRTLVDGLWPNCDALPRREVEGQGGRIEPSRLIFETGRGVRHAARAPSAAPPPAGIAPPARVSLRALETLWINTGTRCNLACATCYIESSPRNDRLAYMTAADAAALMDEIASENLPVALIGFTGGEPFLNPEFPAMLKDALDRGFRTLVLTNAMKPMQRAKPDLAALALRHGDRLALRVSLDHYTKELHELERGPRSFEPAIEGLRWLVDAGIAVSVAGRLLSGESEQIARGGYARLFADLGLPLDAMSEDDLVMFPEMDASTGLRSVTQEEMAAVGVAPDDLMCAKARMAVRRKGAARPTIVACTLLAYEPEFELGASLAEARGEVSLGHPYCADFCVFGGATCERAVKARSD
ncbi:MAG: radical SAM protein [Hyphomicrobiales bacterium]|nr:radical SAM protein [Hyphomicrobiales bacterium]